ncbi:hypothetical protein TDB9533_00657 [Thalassocella blandensis]|nr:hypothetical protein TDB9533_00657 [Thalassocella blandensis]
MPSIASSHSVKHSKSVHKSSGHKKSSKSSSHESSKSHGHHKSSKSSKSSSSHKPKPVIVDPPGHKHHSGPKPVIVDPPGHKPQPSSYHPSQPPSGPGHPASYPPPPPPSHNPAIPPAGMMPTGGFHPSAAPPGPPPNSFGPTHNPYLQSAPPSKPAHAAPIAAKVKTLPAGIASLAPNRPSMGTTELVHTMKKTLKMHKGDEGLSANAWFDKRNADYDKNSEFKNAGVRRGEFFSMVAYTDCHYKDMNAAGRELAKGKQIDQSMFEILKAADAGFAKIENSKYAFTGETRRFTKLPPNVVNDLKAGNTSYIDGGFTSSSYKSTPTNDLFKNGANAEIILHIKRGTNMNKVSAHRGEAEVVSRLAQPFEKTAGYQKEGLPYYTTELTQIPPEGK